MTGPPRHGPTRPPRRGSARWWLTRNLHLAGNECMEIPKLRLNGKGYARIEIDGRMVMAHRFVYETVHGPIPAALEVDHMCNNRACINPRHLQLLSHTENAREVVRRGRHPGMSLTHCKHGHPLSGNNLHLTPRGYRVCRACRIDRGRRYRQKSRRAA